LRQALYVMIVPMVPSAKGEVTGNTAAVFAERQCLA
jgi:hypothetical protein